MPSTTQPQPQPQSEGLDPGGTGQEQQQPDNALRTLQQSRKQDIMAAILMGQCLPGFAWEPNQDAPLCNQCKREFTLLFRRRHHCRRCGLIFCYSCSLHTAWLAVPLSWASDERHSHFFAGYDNDPLEHLRRIASQPGQLPANSDFRDSSPSEPSSHARLEKLPWSLTLQRVCTPCFEVLKSHPIPAFLPVYPEEETRYPTTSVAAAYPAQTSPSFDYSAPRRRHSSHDSVAECPVCTKPWSELWPQILHYPGLGWQESQERHVQQCLADIERRLGGRSSNNSRVDSNPEYQGPASAARASQYDPDSTAALHQQQQRSPPPPQSIPPPPSHQLSEPSQARSFSNATSGSWLSSQNSTPSGHHRHNSNMSPQPRGVRSVMGVRYIAYNLPTNTPLIDQECPICFEEFAINDKVARLNCMCTYHLHCIQAWLERTPACPVHYE